MCFIKLKRTKELEELFKYPNEFILLSLIAYRAKRTENRFDDLEIGEAMIGDISKIRMSNSAYRRAKNRLSKWKLCAFRGTSRGTIATLLDSSIYDINPQTAELSSEQSKDYQVSNQKAIKGATNNNVKNEKNDNTGSGKTRKPNLIWDKICESFHLDPKTKSEKSRLGKISRDLKAKEATPERIDKIITAYAKVFPGATCTPEAIVKHWDTCKAYLTRPKEPEGLTV